MFILNNVFIKDKLRLESFPRQSTVRIAGSEYIINYKSKCNNTWTQPFAEDDNQTKSNLVFQNA